MPGLNGLEASRAILLKCPDAPILLLTIFASTQLAAQAKEARDQRLLFRKSKSTALRKR